MGEVTRPKRRMNGGCFSHAHFAYFYQSFTSLREVDRYLYALHDTLERNDLFVIAIIFRYDLCRLETMLHLLGEKLEFERCQALRRNCLVKSFK